jgi:hypothetical protein
VSGQGLGPSQRDITSTLAAAQMAHGQMAHGQMQPGQMAHGQMQPGQMQPGQMQPGGSGPVYAYSGPVSSASVPGVTTGVSPAHFRTPSVPLDPPGTSITSNHRVSGRPAVSWAAALLACGLFVGVAAVAVLQSSDAVAETTASFVDPSRAPIRNAAAPGMAPTPVPVTPNGVPSPNPFTAPPPQPGAVAPPPTPAPAPTTPPPPGAGVGGFSPVVGGFAPIAVAPSASAPPAKPKAVWRPFVAPARAAKPAVVASNDEEAKEAREAKEAKKEAKAAEAKEAPRGKKKDAPDDETKKAYEALQKAQLESANAFGN